MKLSTFTTALLTSFVGQQSSGVLLYINNLVVFRMIKCNGWLFTSCRRQKKGSFLIFTFSVFISLHSAASQIMFLAFAFLMSISALPLKYWDTLNQSHKVQLAVTNDYFHYRWICRLFVNESINRLVYKYSEKWPL